MLLPPFTLAAFLLLAAALICQCAGRSRTAALLATGSLGTALAGTLVTPAGAAALLALALCGVLVRRTRQPLPWIVWSAALLALALHLLPGFANPRIWQGQMTPDSLPYALYWSYDKGAAGWLMLAALHDGPARRMHRDPRWLAVAAGLLCLVFGLAWLAGKIAPAPKLPVWLPWWLFANLFLVSLAEEAFFRQGLQRWLEQRMGAVPSLLLASLAFGAAHIAGGIGWVLLATLAGIAYGLVYTTTRQVAWSTLAHTGFNLLHLLLFTYPALAGS